MSEKLQKIHYPPCNMRMIRTWLIVAGDPILCNVIHFFHVIHWLGLTRLWLICSCREIHARRHNHNCLMVKYRSKSPWWHTVAIQPIYDLLNRLGHKIFWYELDTSINCQLLSSISRKSGDVSFEGLKYLLFSHLHFLI